MGYAKQTWAEGVPGGTPLSPDRLNHMEDGIQDAADRVTAVESGKVSKGDLGVNVKDYGAKLDGVTDDTAAMRAAIAALPANGGHLLLRGGVALTNVVYIPNKTNLTITFDDATLKARPVSEGTPQDVGLVLALNNCQDVRIVNARIDGNRANITDVSSGSTGHGQQVGLRISNCTRVQVLAPTIVETVHDAIQGATTKQINIIGPVLENIGESGVYFHHGAEDITVLGGSWKNIAINGWGNFVQLRSDVSRASIVGGVANTCGSGGFAFTEGVVDVCVTGFTANNCSVPYGINLAGTTNLSNSRIRFTGCRFTANPAVSLAYIASSQSDLHITDCTFKGYQYSINGFDSLIGCVIDGFNVGSGVAAVECMPSSRVSSTTIKNVTGRGINVGGSNVTLSDVTFDTLSDLAVRIQTTGTGLRRTGLRFKNVPGGPIFDSANAEAIISVQGKAAVAAATPGTVTKKVELFDEAGVSIGFVPVYDSII